MSPFTRWLRSLDWSDYLTTLALVACLLALNVLTLIFLDMGL